MTLFRLVDRLSQAGALSEILTLCCSAVEMRLACR
jgi:hypothetical protein